MVNVVAYLHLSKYIDSDHLCYINIASFTSPERSIPWYSRLSSISITIQACAKNLYEKRTLEFYDTHLAKSFHFVVAYNLYCQMFLFHLPLGQRTPAYNPKAIG